MKTRIIEQDTQPTIKLLQKQGTSHSRTSPETNKVCYKFKRQKTRNYKGIAQVKKPKELGLQLQGRKLDSDHCRGPAHQDLFQYSP